jgi:hypothetical protein
MPKENPPKRVLNLDHFVVGFKAATFRTGKIFWKIFPFTF